VREILKRDPTGLARPGLPTEGSVAVRAGANLSGLDEQDADERLYRLMGEGRYQQDVFTTYTAPHMDVVPAYDASQLVLHNDAEAGYWMALNGRVYDVTRFAHMHPGGFKVIRGYTGMDATRAYRKVLHHTNPEVDSMLGMFEMGAVRRLDFGMEWGVAIGPRGLQFVPLADVYRAWARFLYTLVEMQNALDNDYTLREQALTGDEDPAAPSPLKLQFLLEVHERFLLNYVEGSLGQPLEDLWAVTSGLCDSRQDVRWMRDAIARVQSSQEADTVRRLSGELAARIRDVAARGAGEGDAAARLVVDACALLEREDRRFLREVKMALRAGVQVFEAHEREAIRRGGEQLMDILKDVPELLEDYHARVLAGALRLFVMRDE
jgi:sulfite reductase (NADPH) flavoprotein alpha-component